MRLRTISTVWLIGGGWLAPDSAAATSCYQEKEDTSHNVWLEDDEDEADVPVDAVLWQTPDCPYGHPPRVPACELVRYVDDEKVTSGFTVELVGDEACARGSGEVDGHDSYLRRFVPDEPLIAGAEYSVICADGEGGFTFTVRGDEEPAAPPEALTDVDVHYTRDDEGCCGGGDFVELRIGDLDAAYLGEGGYIEIVYAGGWRYGLTRPRNGEFFVLPPTRDPFTLTPVAADGTRGETARTGEVDGDLVYLPCNAAVRPTPFAPWLLAPFVWMCVHGRRRRAV